MNKTSYSDKISGLISLLILFLLAFGLTATAFSKSEPDGIRMHDGKVWLTKSGQTILLEKEIIVAGGTFQYVIK
jgi:hypothetical protein